MFDLDIYVTDLATGSTRNLTNTPGEWDEHAILSPGGRKIVWMSSHGYRFAPSQEWGNTLNTEYWLMNADGSGKRQLTWFNVPGSPEHTGERVVVADSSWNRRGDQLVALGLGKGGGRISLIEFANPVDDSFRGELNGGRP